MKRFVLLFMILAVWVLPIRSQDSEPAATHSAHEHAKTEHSDHAQMMCGRMMAEHAAELKATSQTLATNLAQMKAMLPLISDINERSRWQSNIAMWQAVADHFSHMAEHGAHMQEMGTGCGMTDHSSKSASPAKAQ